MKLILNTWGAIGALGLLFSPLQAQNNLESLAIESAEKIESASEVFENMLDDGSIEFKVEGAEADYLRALRSLDRALSKVRELENSLSSDLKMESVIKRLQLVQELMMGYFAEEEIFGYHLARPDVDIEIGGDVILRELLEEFDFVNIGGSGRVRIGGRGDITKGFNKLKGKFIGLLTEGSRIDPQDRGLRAFGRWAEDTKVIYPGETFGKKVIEQPLLVDLGLWF